MKKPFRVLCFIAAFFLFTASLPVSAEELRGYSKKEGYIYVTLGQYPQFIDGGNPLKQSWRWYMSKTSVTREDFTPEPILWRVLTADDEKAYLTSEYVLFAMPMHRDYNEYAKIGSDFGRTELCAYLNDTFLTEAFTPEEAEMLLPCETFGKVFLLDSADVKNADIGLGTGKGLRCWGTEYAIRVTGAYVFESMNGSHSAYWVRNQATSDARHARCTKHDGSLGHIIADRDNEGVRPAVWLAMDSFDIAGGSGTKEDPYTLSPKLTPQ